jgi:ATP-dependent Clp protease ATP-binding subunit ClpA
MFETFTDRARKVMQLANQEAQRFNHYYIGTEHILLGLVKEGSGMAVDVLKNLDIDLRKIGLEVEKIIQYGPDSGTVGELPQTSRAKKVIEYALEEARKFKQRHVGTEHLLLGLIRAEEGVASQVLLNLGLTLEVVRRAISGVPLSHSDRPWDIEEEAVQTLPPETRQTLKELEAQIDQLNAEKETAVGACDFERAAQLRDQADSLKKRRQEIIREGLK